jgi:hypothetical protein
MNFGVKHDLVTIIDCAKLGSHWLGVFSWLVFPTESFYSLYNVALR